MGIYISALKMWELHRYIIKVGRSIENISLITRKTFVYFFLYFSRYSMYELFLDAVSSRGKILLLHKGEVVWENELELVWNESSKLWVKVFSFLECYGVDTSQLWRIFLVHGPGSFTGIRSICLFCNTLAYIYPHLILFPLSFFDLYESYPIVKQSSRRDVFVKMQKNATIEILPITELKDLLVWYREVWWSFDVALLERENLFLHQDYSITEVLSRYTWHSSRCVEPLYMKAPNIY